MKKTVKYLKYYINLGTTRRKLAAMLHTFRFGTVQEVLAATPIRSRYFLANGELTRQVYGVIPRPNSNPDATVNP